MSQDHAHWMRRAIALARRGFGCTSPNPLVGAILVIGDQAVGEGWHVRAGGSHAEVAAIQAANCDLRNATIYVTLEPCSTHGRTPPCVEAILKAGISQIVIGATDPNPAHCGAGIELLRAAGCEVRSGVLADRCRELNEAFYCWIRHQRPLVLLKMAMTLDGKIATQSGQSQWITGPVARRRVQRLRQWADAIMVGGETIRKDDPQLLVRTPQNWAHQPLRFVATRAPIAESAQVIRDGGVPAEAVHCETREQWQAWLAGLGQREITALLVEGGGELAGVLLEYGLVDEIAFFIAPKLLGGRNSRSVVAGTDPLALANSAAVREMKAVRCGDDLLITGRLSDVHRAD